MLLCCCVVVLLCCCFVFVVVVVVVVLGCGFGLRRTAFGRTAFRRTAFRRTAFRRTAFRRTAQNFALFLPFPATVSFFLCLSGCLLVEFWWCLKCRNPKMCTLGLSGCRMNEALARERRSWNHPTTDQSKGRIGARCWCALGRRRFNQFVGFLPRTLDRSPELPIQFRGRFRQAVRLALEARSEVVTKQDAVMEERAWKLFCVLPVTLLRKPRGQGKVGGDELSHRFDKFSRGQWAELLQEAQVALRQDGQAQRQRTDDTPGRRAEAASMPEGEVGGGIYLGLGCV